MTVVMWFFIFLKTWVCTWWTDIAFELVFQFCKHLFTFSSFLEHFLHSAVIIRSVFETNSESFGSWLQASVWPIKTELHYMLNCFNPEKKFCDLYCSIITVTRRMTHESVICWSVLYSWETSFHYYWKLVVLAYQIIFFVSLLWFLSFRILKFFLYHMCIYSVLCFITILHVFHLKWKCWTPSLDVIYMSIDDIISPVLWTHFDEILYWELSLKLKPVTFGKTRVTVY